MKIWAISDTHMMHNELVVPDDIDLVIHTGDGTNSKSKYDNEPELREFIHWFHNLPIKHKIFTGGNHDSALAGNLVKIPDDIIILQDRSIYIEGVKIFGSPYSITFGHGWSYNVSRDKSHVRWDSIDEDVDIIATHGPPMSILDVTRDRGKLVEQCGDKSLLKRVIQINPKYHIFGHLHDEVGVYNAGIFYNANLCDTRFVNASVVDLRHKLTNNGQIIEI